MAIPPTEPRGPAHGRERWLPAALVGVGGTVTVILLLLGGIDALMLLVVVAGVALLVWAVPWRGARWLVLLAAGILGTALLAAASFPAVQFVLL